MTIIFLPVTILTLPLAWHYFSGQVWSISVFNWAHYRTVYVPGEHIKVRIFLIVRVFNPWLSLQGGDGESLPKGSIFPSHRYIFKYNFLDLQDRSEGTKVYGLLSRCFDLLFSGKTLSLVFFSVFCYAVPWQVPGITVDCIEQYSSLSYSGSHRKEKRKAINICDMNIVGHGIWPFRKPYLKAETSTQCIIYPLMW